MAFGGGVVLPGRCNGFRRSRGMRWSGCSVGKRLPRCSASRSGVLFTVLGVQGAVGFFGYEMIHRIQAVLTVVLFVTFVVFAVKLAAGHQIVTPATVQGADLVGAFVLEVTIALSLSISWASYAADFSRYLPTDSSRLRVFGHGRWNGHFVQGIGIAAGDLVSEQTADGSGR